MISLENISIKVGEFKINNLSLDVEAGEYFVVLGISGVGKSLLLESIAGLIKLISGKIFLRGKDVTNEKIQNRNVSIVYQDADLFPHLTVFENIAYPLRSKRINRITEKVLHSAKLVGIEEKLNRKPNTLSGGEYQRVALARSLAAGSDIFLLDEPLSSLDSQSKHELRYLLRELNRNGITIIHVTHDYEEAVSLASKIGIMENGNLTDIGTPEEIFKRPKSEFVASFVGVKNFMRGELKSNIQNELKDFITDKIKVHCLTAVEDGEAFLMILPQEINISNEKNSGSSRNNFKGKVVDISPAVIGMEITVNAGYEFVVSISKEVIGEMNLNIGKEVWISFKASACKIYR